MALPAAAELIESNALATFVSCVMSEASAAASPRLFVEVFVTAMAAPVVAARRARLGEAVVPASVSETVDA